MHVCAAELSRTTLPSTAQTALTSMPLTFLACLLMSSAPARLLLMTSWQQLLGSQGRPSVWKAFWKGQRARYLNLIWSVKSKCNIRCLQAQEMLDTKIGDNASVLNAILRAQVTHFHITVKEAPRAKQPAAPFSQSGVCLREQSLLAQRHDGSPALI